MHDGKSFGKIKVVKNNTSAIDDFVAWISSLEGKKLLFRGHADSTWKVEASGYRRLGQNATPATFHNSTKRLIDNARLRGLDKKDGMQMPDLELLAELQHYGAATCLIDFTENPYTALWFACHEHQDRDGAVVAMASDDSEKFSEITGENKGEKITKFLQQEKIWKWTPPHAQNNRIVAQSSIFLFGPSRISAKLYEKKIIKNSDKKNIMAYLRDKLSITEQRLFSDFAGFAMANAHNKEYTEYGADDYFSLGLTHHQRGEYKEAIEYYDQAIEINNQHAKAYNNRGIIKAELGKHKEAIQDYDKAIKISPLALPYNNRGLAKLKLGKCKEAIQDYDKAIEINPQYAEAYFNRGIAKVASGSQKEAIKDYNKAIEINPQFAEAYFNRGTEKAELGNHEEAIKDYNKAIEINPQFALAYNNRGNAKAELDNHTEAIKDYGKAIEINPQDAKAYYNRGIAQSALGNHKEAIKDFDQAIATNPKLAKAYNNRGSAQLALGNLKEAIADYSQAIATNPKLADAYNNRGVVKQHTGDQAGAGEDFAMDAKLTNSQNGNNNPPSTPTK